MSNPFDQFDAAPAGDSEAANPFDQFDAGAKPKKQNKGIAGDLVTDIKRGVEQLPSIATGLADIPIAAITGQPYADKASDALGGITGFRPSQWAKDAEAEYSPGRQAAKANVNQAWEQNQSPFSDAAKGDFAGIGQIAKSYIQNPQQLIGSVAESLPSMVAGGIAGRAAMGVGARGVSAAAGGVGAELPGTLTRFVGEKAAPVIAGSGGEGAVMAGQQMDQLTEAGADPRTAAAAAAATGIVGGAIGALGGKVAQKFGVVDPDTAMASGALRGVTDEAKDQTIKGMIKDGAKRVAGGAASEGLFEELPQSVLEQVLSNLAQNKSWDDGVSRAAVEGTLAGALMGGAFNVAPPKQEPKNDVPPGEQPGAEQLPMLSLPAPTYTGTPGDQIVTNDAERQAAIDAADANAATLQKERDDYEQWQAELRRNNITIVNDPEPLQQRIDALMGINESRLQGFARTNYEKALENAFGEQVGFVVGKDGLEIPFTMGDYLKSKVRAADIDRKSQGAAAPAIPVVGPLSAAANIAVQSGAHAATVAQQQAAIENSQAEASSTQPGKADTPTTGNREAAPQAGILAGIAAQAPSVAPTAPNTQPQGQGGMPATAQQAGPAATSPAGGEFDVSKRTNGQLSYLASNGQPGWKEAAVAELQKRGVQVSAPQQAKSDTLSAEKPANSATVPAQKAEDSAKTPAAPVEVNVEVRQNQKAKGEKLIFINGEQVGVVSRARSPGTSDWGFRGSLSGELHFTEEKAVAAETEAAKKHYSNRIKVAAMEAEMPPAAETKPKPENKKPTEPPTFWTSSTPAHRKWIMDASGLKQYTALTPWNRIKPEHQAQLIAQWGDKPVDQNPIKNESPAAAMVSKETKAPEQESIKKSDHDKAMEGLAEAWANDDAEMESRIKFAADSVLKLRKVDVERVLSQGNVDRQKLADYIKRKRVDLAAEVNDVMAELSAPAVDAVSQPKTDNRVWNDTEYAGVQHDTTSSPVRTWRYKGRRSEAIEFAGSELLPEYPQFYRQELVDSLPADLVEYVQGEVRKRLDWYDKEFGVIGSDKTPLAPPVSQQKTDAATEAKHGKAEPLHRFENKETGMVSMVMNGAKPGLFNVVVRDEDSGEYVPIAVTGFDSVEKAIERAKHVIDLKNDQDQQDRFANNTIFTADKVAAAKARMKAKLGTMNSGIDPELLIDGMTIAGAYIESGVRKFADYAKAMVEDLGDGVKPYLLSFYEAARAYPGLNKMGMDTQEAAAKQHQAILTPEVKAAAKEVIGESPKVEKKKPANLGEAVRLKADWGVKNIDGYTRSKTGKNQETDYGLKGGIKDEFLADATRYLKAVAKLLEASGFTAQLDSKGKPFKTVSTGEGSPAVGGDAYLRMSKDGFEVFAQVGVTNVRGIGPAHPQGVSLMVRAGERNGMNNWLSTDLTAGELAAWFNKATAAAVQQAPEKTTGYDLSKADDKFKVATDIADFFIGGGEFKTIIEARKKISEMIGRPIEAATELAKQADETIETAVVLAGRDIVKAGRKQGRSAEVIYDRLVDLYRRQPNLAVRSSTSVRDQAYSTPVPLAYLASELAGINYDTKVLEPTAGNGMLLIGASTGNAVVNELNADRADVLRSLGFNPTERNAATEQLRHAGYPVDAVIANPPFGAVKDANGETIIYDVKPGFQTREVDHAIVFKSLEAMKDDGRAVLIVGGVQSEEEEARREDYRGKNKRTFYYNLYNEYNVIDHFTADGGLYSKQGASYPVDIIVIDGRGKSSRDMPAADLPVIFKSYDALKEKLNGNGRVESKPVVGANGTDSGNGQSGQGDASGLAGSPVGSSGKDGQGSTDRIGAEGVRNDGSANNGRPGGSGAVSGGWQSEFENASGSVNGSAVPNADRNAESGSKTSNRGNRPDDLGGTSVVNGERVESGLADRRGLEQETGHQVAYNPHSNAASVGTLVPRAMKDSIAASLQKISDEVGSIDDYVAESLAMDVEDVKSNFSAEQIDALALAIRNAEAGKGFIIGDQTGIGKGRVVAAMIRYALVTGKTPIFVTEKPNLYSDMIRDLDDIGMTAELALDTKNPKVLITNGGESIPYTLLRTEKGEVVENNLMLRAPKAGKALDQLMQSMMSGESLGEYKVIFTTYSQLQTVKGATTTRQRFIQQFGEGNYMVFDESHNAGGAGETQARTKEQRQAEKDGQSLVTGRAAFVRNLVQRAFGTFFSSATYAKRPDVMDLYSSTNMKLAVDRISQLGEAIKSGGVPMQQVVANMLTKDGQYIRRERTFAGVSYDTQETKVDKETAENMASAMRSILAFSRAKESVLKEMQKEMDREGGMLREMGGEKSSVQGANFGSIMHNLIDQMLLSLKVQDSVAHAIDRLKAGEKVVLTVSNTMGSFLKDYSEELGLSAGDPVSMSFSDLYNRYLEKQRNVTIKDGAGNKRQHRLTDAELGPRLVDMFNAVRKQIDSSGFGSAPISPIDYMHNELRKAGYKTDEITGRTIALNYSSGTPILASRSANIRQRVKAVSGFNNGDTDVLILNQAGSTGLSLHASSKFKDKRKRHMIIVQAEKNIDTHMQMLGRVHRTGQVVAPAYSQMMADIPAEMRPASVLMKKMASLNANTTASRSSSVTAEGVVDFMNDYGGQVVHEYLRDNPDVLEAVGGNKVISLADDPAEAGEDDIRKFTGYIPILPIKQQEEVYRELVDRYNELIERENSLGTNKLEAKAVDLDAETISSQPVTENRGDPSVFAAPANMEKVDVKRTVKPYSSEEVSAMVAESLGGKRSYEIASQQSADLTDKATAYGREKVAKMTADGVDPVKIESQKAQLNLVWIHAKTVLSTYRIGDSISIKDQIGQFLYGVITKVEHSGRTANPAAGSAWKMHIALANGDAKSITISFSQIGSKYELRTETNVDWYNIETQSVDRIPILDIFDKGSKVRREKRWIVTGNILAGFARFPGQIITYTKNDGTTAQGVLMSRQFDFEKEQKNAPVRIKDGKAAINLFTNGGPGTIIGTPDRNLMVAIRRGEYEITVPSSKKDGGTYYLDQGLTNIVGDFYKRGSIMSASVYTTGDLERMVNYLVKDREENIVALSNVEKAKELLQGNDGSVGNIAAPGSLSPADTAIYGMASDGKSAAEILKFIASASRSPFYRQLAKLLLKTGIAPQVMASTTEGWRFNAGNDKKYAAAYNESTNTIALFIPAAAERNFLHEAMHAATIRALGRKGLASGQMKALFEHVKKNGNLKGMYGMSDIDEFVAEAFSNPKFQDMLKKVAAPTATGGKLSSAWDWFVRVVRGILGLKQNDDSALAQALEIGVGVMREDMKLRKDGPTIPFAEISGNEIDRILGRTIQEKATNWMRSNLQGKSFVNDETGWDISVGRKGINKAMMHAAKDIHARSVAAIPTLLKNAVLVASEENRNAEERKSVPFVHHLYAPMRIGGVDYVARLVVKEAKDGTRFYDYETSDEISPAVPDKFLPFTQRMGNSPSARLDMSMAELLSYVKAEHGGTDPKFIRYAAGPKQTDSAAFRKWFGKSKVVDENGQPLVVYHGTSDDFTVFGNKYAGRTWEMFSDSSEYSNRFASSRGGRLVPVYLSLRNPLDMRSLPAIRGDVRNKLIPLLEDAGVKFGNNFKMSDLPYERDLFQIVNMAGHKSGFADAVMAAGYDGIIMPDNHDGDYLDDGGIIATTYIALNPGQIKSAIGNSGDFDGTNPDIRYNVADDGWSVSEPSKMDDLIYAMQDKQIDMRRVVQSIMRTGKKVKDEVNAYLQEELFHGRAAKGVKDFLDFELRPLLKQMQEAKVDMGDFEEYLWNRHAEERNKQIAKINPDMPDGGSGIETAKARAYLAGLSAEQRKTFEALAAKVETMNRESQRVLVESGLEKQSTIDAWNGAYQHYVPLQREDVDSGHVGTGKGFSVRGSSSKRAMGSGKKVVDIIANLTMQRERNIVRAEKNRVSNALLGLAVQNPNPDFWKVDQAPKERVVQEKAIYTVLDSDGNKIEEFTRMDEAERLANKTPGAIIDQAWGDRVTERVMPGFTSRDNVLLTRINGEDHYVIFNERDERAMRMATAMKNLDMDNLGRVLSVVGKATRYLASINTQYNPVFGVINLIRDAQGALINLSSTPLAGEQKRVLGYTKDALVGIYKDIRAHRAGGKPSSNWAALFEEFQKEGGQTGYRDQYANAEARAESIKSELEQFKDGKAKQLARGLFGWLSDYNETMENAVRLAAYKAAKEKGMSKQQAASLAKNITVNFNRKGQMATQVGSLYAFFNASVQGTARIAGTLFDMKDGDIRTARLSSTGKKIVYGGIMLGSMQALLLAAAGFGDDEPPDFIKERNLILPIGDGKYLTLAMPLGYHVFPGIGRLATEFVLSGGKDPLKKIAAFGSMFAEALNPIGNSGFSLQTITPSVIDPLAALAENRDFTGKEIYQNDFNKLNPTPGFTRAKDTATAWSKAIAEGLNFITGGTDYKPGLFTPTPDQIDYLIGQVTGGVGREVGKVSQVVSATTTGEDLPIYKVPLVGRFVGDTQGKSGESAKFYNSLREINMHEAEYKGLIGDGKRQEAAEYLAENPAVKLIMLGNQSERAVKKLKEAKRNLIENDAPQEKVAAMEDQIAKSMKLFNDRVTKALAQ